MERKYYTRLNGRPNGFMSQSEFQRLCGFGMGERRGDHAVYTCDNGDEITLVGYYKDPTEAELKRVMIAEAHHKAMNEELVPIRGGINEH